MNSGLKIGSFDRVFGSILSTSNLFCKLLDKRAVCLILEQVPPLMGGLAEVVQFMFSEGTQVQFPAIRSDDGTGRDHARQRLCPPGPAMPDTRRLIHVSSCQIHV